MFDYPPISYETESHKNMWTKLAKAIICRDFEWTEMQNSVERQKDIDFQITNMTFNTAHNVFKIPRRNKKKNPHAGNPLKKKLLNIVGDTHALSLYFDEGSGKKTSVSISNSPREDPSAAQPSLQETHPSKEEGALESVERNLVPASPYDDLLNFMTHRRLNRTKQLLRDSLWDSGRSTDIAHVRDLSEPNHRSDTVSSQNHRQQSFKRSITQHSPRRTLSPPCSGFNRHVEHRWDHEQESRSERS